MTQRYRHDGGPCPVDPEAIVVVRFRNGVVAEPRPARQWRWPLFDHGPGAWDIVAYRDARPIGEIIKPIMADIASRVEAK